MGNLPVPHPVPAPLTFLRRQVFARDEIFEHQVAGALLEGKGSLENIRGACRECRFRNGPAPRDISGVGGCQASGNLFSDRGACAVRTDEQIAGFDAAAGKAGGDPVAVLFKADEALARMKDLRGQVRLHRAVEHVPDVWVCGMKLRWMTRSVRSVDAVARPHAERGAGLNSGEMKRRQDVTLQHDSTPRLSSSLGGARRCRRPTRGLQRRCSKEPPSEPPMISARGLLLWWRP